MPILYFGKQCTINLCLTYILNPSKTKILVYGVKMCMMLCWICVFLEDTCMLLLLYKGRQEGCVLILCRRLWGVSLAHTSAITSKRCIQPHGECGRVDRWPSALGWWCRRRRACHSSCNWGGMPGLAGPFHLRPAVRWKTQKIQELIMSLLGFWSAVWGWNRPPQSSSSSARPRRASPRQRKHHTISFNSLTLNPSFFIYHHIPFHTPAIILFSLFLPLPCFASHLYHPAWICHYQPL